MGRYTSNGSSGTSGTSVTPAITTTVVAGEAISAGDLVTLSEDNLAYYAVEPRLPGAAVRPVYRPVAATNVAVTPVTTVSNSIATNYNNNIAQAVLSNGNVVLVWVESSSPYNVRFGIYNNFGQLQGAIGTVGTTPSSSSEISVAAIPSGGFVIAYCSSTDPKFSIFNNLGAVIVAQTSVQSSGNNSRSVAVTVLSNGNIAIAYLIQNSTIYEPSYAVFSPAGTVVKAAASLNTPTAQSSSVHAVDMCALVGGGFVVSYYIAPGVVNCRRIDNVGTYQGSEIAVFTAFGVINGFSYLKALTGGGFVVGAYANNTTFRASVYNASGVLQGSQITLDSAASYYFGALAIVSFSSGNWSAIWNTQNQVRAQSFSATGTATGGAVILFSSSYNYGAVVAAVSASDELAIIAGITSGSNPANLIVTDSALNVKSLGSTSDFGNLSSSLILASYFPFSAFSSTASSLFVTSVNGSNLVSGVRTGYVPACVPMGVAIAGAPKGGSVPVQITGNTTLRTGFTQPFSIDTNGNLPPGQRMSIIGNQAILQGMQGAQRRSIN